MVNRNAARHLVFIISILLCFFVYMGYRTRRGGDAGTDVSMPPATEFASYTPNSPGSADPLAGIGMVAPPPSFSGDPAASLPSVIASDNDEVWVPSARGEDLALVPPPQAATQLKPPFRPPPAMPEPIPHSEVITGLIPALPGEIVESEPVQEASAFSPMPVLPPPGAIMETAGRPQSEEVSALPGYLPLPGSGLKPPSTHELSFSEEYADAVEDIDMIPAPPGAPSFATGLSGSGDGDLAPAYSAYSPPIQPVQPISATPLPSVAPLPPVVPVAQPTAAPIAPPGALAGERAGERAVMPPPSGGTGAFQPSVAPAPVPEHPVAASNGSVPSAFRSSVPEPVRPAGEMPESLRIYLVRPGDSLSSIAAHELGAASMADNIFLLNRDVIADPDHLMVGIKIRLPIRDGGYGYGDGALQAAGGAAAGGRRPTQGLGRTHTVARGDTLSSIAQKYYGSGSAWRFLYEANRKVVPNPDTLSVGTELEIPPYNE